MRRLFFWISLFVCALVPAQARIINLRVGVVAYEAFEKRHSDYLKIIQDL
jgi:hypothetical protein